MAKVNKERIRNIRQSHQEREIIKTAPDMVVYIDGLPFILNPYLSSSSKDMQAVNFNDYITAVSATYSVDSLVPSGSINLTVPNGFKHLFTAPGGETIFETMMSVRIYAKCYFFSQKGNTVFRRVFNGLIKSISFNETQTGLEISISIAGIGRLLEILQIEQKGSVLGTGPSSNITPLVSTMGNISLADAIYQSFERALNFEEFLTSSVLQKERVTGLKESEAIKQEYIARWGVRLQDLRRDVRIFGTLQKTLTTPVTTKSQATGTQQGTDGATANNPPSENKKESEKVKDNTKPLIESTSILDAVRTYMPDFHMSGIPLTGGSLTTRLDKIRQLVDMAGMEGYQDIDGLIIIKPPLYNLDSTIIGDRSTGVRTVKDESGSERKVDELKDENLYEEANPFIVHMAEILSEQYSEDEGGIRTTSMVVAPNFASPTSVQVSPGKTDLSPLTRYVDINLLKQFGVREQPPKYAGFLSADTFQNMAYAISELNRNNRNFRTYQITIPLRPELRLGFPIYVPHKDMYAYVWGASITYNVGGQATMSLTCNYIRKRPLLPTKQSIKTDTEKDADEKQEATNQALAADGLAGGNYSGSLSSPEGIDDVIVYVSQPNLVHYWSPSDPPKKDDNAGNAQVKEAGTEATAKPVKSEQTTKDQLAVILYKRYKYGSLDETKTDGVGKWLVGLDGALTYTPADDEIPDVKGEGLFNGELVDGKKTKIKYADKKYMKLIASVQPYTDEKGYEVVPCLPWGRYSTLRQALSDCTRNYWKGEADASKIKNEVDYNPKGTETFLMAGTVVPSWTDTSALKQELANCRSKLQAAEEATGAAVEGAAAAQSDYDNAVASGDPMAMDLNSVGIYESQNATATASAAMEKETTNTASAQAAASAAAVKRTKEIKETLHKFDKFEKSNVISFELAYKSSDFGKTEVSFPTEDNTAFGNANLMVRLDPFQGDEGNPSANVLDRVNTFLSGFMQDVMSSGTGRYAVSTMAQNTDIGGYRFSGGPFSGVLGGIKAQFEAGSLGAILGTSKTGSAYFTSGYESRGNRSW